MSSNEPEEYRECPEQPSHWHWRNGRLHTITSSTRAGRSSRTASTSVSRPPGAGRSCSFLHNFVALSGYHAAPEPEGGMPWPAQTVSWKKGRLHTTMSSTKRNLTAAEKQLSRETRFWTEVRVWTTTTVAPVKGRLVFCGPLPGPRGRETRRNREATIIVVAAAL